MNFIDTDILIDFYRNSQPAVDFLEGLGFKNKHLSISSITKMELFIGCRNKRELRETKKFLDQFSLVHFNGSISVKAVELIEQYNLSHGLLMADAVIAATAMILDGELFSKNLNHFVFIEGLKVTRPY